MGNVSGLNLVIKGINEVKLLLFFFEKNNNIHSSVTCNLVIESWLGFQWTWSSKVCSISCIKVQTQRVSGSRSRFIRILRRSCNILSLRFLIPSLNKLLPVQSVFLVGRVCLVCILSSLLLKYSAPRAWTVCELKLLRTISQSVTF